MTPPFAALLPNRGVIRLGGEDRRDFLQGLISNDIAQCTPGHVLYAALLTPQGKFLHDLFIVDDGNSFLIDCEGTRADDLLTILRKHKLRAKLTFEDARNGFDVWAMWPVAAPNDPRLSALGSRLMIAKGTQPKDVQLVDFSTYDKHRLSLGVPDGSRDMLIEKSNLLECNIDKLNGISWSKGCYMGQELTARMHYRALVKKRLYPVKIAGVAPTLGTIVTLNGEDIGDMRNSCGDVGLALLNVEKAQKAITDGTTLESGRSRLTAHKPEWMKL